MFSSPYPRTRPGNDEKNAPDGEEAKEYACQRPERPLDKPVLRAVQCRDQSVVARLDDRGHPNKVSMRKRKKRKEGKLRGEEGGIYRQGGR